MPFSPTTPAPCQWFSHLAALLDVRSAPRLVRLFLGAVLAAGRRTVTGWLRAAGIAEDFRPAYTAVAAAGKQTDLIAARLAHAALRPMLAGAGRLTLGIDDTPTARYGPHVEGAGVHHNPTPGPAAARFVYGHVWVTLAWLARHPAGGAVALPLLARLYVRRKDMPRVPAGHRPPFRTKLELAVELMRWAVTWLGFLGKALWVAADGAYAKAGFLKPLRALGVTVVSRLRKDAALRSVPGPAGSAGGAGHGSTANAASTWPSGPASGGAGGPACSTCTASPRPRRTRPSWPPGGRPAASSVSCWSASRAAGAPSSARSRPRPWPTSWAPSPTASAWRPPSGTPRRSSGPVSSRSDSCGRTWGRSTSACGPTR
jgi:hypothetical protein